MQKTDVTKRPDENRLIFERVFSAPVSRVFAAFSSADALTQWWGPRGWETTTKELTFEPGGHWHYGMKCVDASQGEWYGQVSWGIMRFDTIDAPNGFTYEDYFSNEQGEIDEKLPSTHTEMAFREVEGGTHVSGTTTCESRQAYDQLVSMGMIEGLSETWDRLDDYVQVRR